MEALNSLYGDTIDLPATYIATESRSSHYDEKRKPRSNLEYGLQCKLVSWALNKGLPIISIPNEGNRGRLATHRLKQAGLRPGVADLFLCRQSPCRQYAGYWIELKAPGQKPRPNQTEFLAEMRSEGYCADWFDDWLLARQSILDYLDGKK